MIAERKIRLCKLLSSESETIEINKKNLAAPLCESLAYRGSVLDN